MADWFWFLFKWLVMAIAVSPIVLGVGWAVVEISILPRLIPRDEIERLADLVMRDHPDDPEGFAFMEEHAEWFRSHTVEQGKWHRVRKTIRRRLMEGG
jgi:beta-galactosidase/beta-glucuronidase